METVASIAGPLTSSRLRWGWLLALGIALILLGTIALGDTFVVTVISVLLIGWLLIVSGIFHVVHLVRHTEVRSFWHILSTIFDFGAGSYMVVNPALGALTLTLVLSVFLLASGVTRLIGVFHTNLPHKFWPVVQRDPINRSWDPSLVTLAMDWPVVHWVCNLDRVDFPGMGLGDGGIGPAEPRPAASHLPRASLIIQRRRPLIGRTRHDSHEAAIAPAPPPTGVYPS